jgi:hypothetical protein
MKSNIVLVIGLLSMGANAATSLTGTAMTKPYSAAGTTVVATGTLAVMLVDTTGNGFIGLGALAGGTLLTASNDPLLTAANMSTTVGGTFGGDTIAAVYAIGGTGISGALSLAADSAFYGKQFAMVFFDTATITDASNYGIARGSDWTFPVSDIGGSIGFSSTDASGAASFFQIQSAAPTANQTSSGFFSVANARPATVFGVVDAIPEPSAALLGALGALGLLRRRRN